MLMHDGFVMSFRVSIFRKKKKKKKKKKVTIHMLTYGAMRGCGLTSLVACIDDKFRDIRERNVTIRREIGTTNIHSLGFQDIREWVTLWVDITEFRV